MGTLSAGKRLDVCPTFDMKLTGGHNVLLEGKPSAEVKELPEPSILHIPLFTERLEFAALCVEDGDQVKQGQVLATDPTNYSVPLLAPRSGKAKVEAASRHITLADVAKEPGEADANVELSEAAKKMGSGGEKRQALVSLGSWQYVSDALTGDVPDPFGTAAAVIVSALHLDPFVARGDVQLRDGLSEFASGMKQLCSLLADQPVYLVLPDVKSDLISKVKEAVAGESLVKVLQVPVKYPYGNLKLIAQGLGFRVGGTDIVWGMGVEGVLAIDTALTSSKPCISRIISIGGPAAKSPSHVRAITGYPIGKIRDGYADGSPVRVVNGGALSGRSLPADQIGLDAECMGLTIIAENTEREVLAWAHIGFGKHAFTRTFASILRPKFRESYTTAIRAEHRPCVSCSCCEQACPAGLMPFLLNRYIRRNRLEEAEKYGLWDCIECGLCSHVCLAKREMSHAFFEARTTLLAAGKEEGQS